MSAGLKYLDLSDSGDDTTPCPGDNVIRLRAEGVSPNSCSSLVSNAANLCAMATCEN